MAIGLLISSAVLADKQRLSVFDRRAEKDFPGIDADGNHLIDPAEWHRRGNFKLLDLNSDGFLDFEEYRAMYQFEGRGRVNKPVARPAQATFDATFTADRIAASELSADNLCAVSRVECQKKKKSDPTAMAAASGLLDTGLGPLFPDNAFCLGIDDYYAQAYESKRKLATSLHGGFDIPAEQDASILAAADGTVVGIYPADNSARGIELMLRHSPADTGLTVWVYTQYAHLSQVPDLRLGQRVQMGEVVGLTGNTGSDPFSGEQSARRRPAIHFAAWYTPSRRFADTGNAIVPEHALWMDPHAIYRGAPFDSQTLKNLPEGEKDTRIPVMFADGTLMPAGTRVIWPYACKRR